MAGINNDEKKLSDTYNNSTRQISYFMQIKLAGQISEKFLWAKVL